MRKADGALAANTAWELNAVPVGGGGYIVHMDVHPATGDLWAGTDVQNGYLRRVGDSRWTTLFTTDSMSSSDYAIAGTGKGDGFANNAAKWCRSNANRLYASVNGYWYRVDLDPAKQLSAVGGITCTRVNLSSKYMLGGTGWSRWWGPRVATHPTDDLTAIFTTANDGCYYTADGGATTTAITIPACSAFPQGFGVSIIAGEAGRGHYLTWIDQGNPLYCYIFVQGVGLHRSTAGVGGPYSLIAGGPLGATCLFGESDGTLWITADERVSLLTNGAFTDLSNWTAVGCTTSIATNATGNIIDVTNSGAAAGYLYQAITVIAGITYNFQTRLSYGATAVGCAIKIGTAAGLSDLGSATTTTPAPGGTNLAQGSFTAASNGTIYVSLVVNSTTTGDYCRFYAPSVGAVGLFQITRGGGTWTMFGNPLSAVGTGNYPWCVSVDPFNNQNIIVAREQVAYYSANRGASWASAGAITIIDGGEVSWRSPTPAPKFGGGCYPDPLVQNRWFWGEGFGVCKSTAFPSIQLTDYSYGIEEKINNNYCIHPVTDKTFVASWDLPVIRIDSFTDYLNTPTRGPVGYTGVQIAGNIDFAIDDQNYYVAACGQASSHHEYSPDAGQTWLPFRSDNVWPGTGGAAGPGKIACSQKGNVVIWPVFSQAVWSSDGTNFNALTLNGSSDYLTIPGTFVLERMCIAADKERAGVFAVVVSMWKPSTSTWDNPLAGLWVSSTNGGDFVQRISGVIGFPGMTYSQVQATGQDARQYYGCQLAFVPGFAGEMLYTPHADFTNDKFFYLTTNLASGAVTVTELNTRLRNIVKFGFGKQLPQNTGQRPAFYFYGDVDGVRGLWVSFDWWLPTATFTAIGPTSSPGNLRIVGKFIGTGLNNGIGASMQTFGRVLSGISGKGSVYLQAKDVAHAT